jgi:hypothetical protein
MKRSITCVGMTLGSAALIALGAGCSRGNRPAKTPPAGTTSPTFESNVPSGSAPSGREQPPGPSYETQPQPPPPSPGSRTFQPEPGEPSSQGGVAEAPPAVATRENERQMCDDLAMGAVLHIEDVQNGVTIVAIPRASSNLSSVRDDAQRIESAMRQRAAGGAPSTPSSEACGLFSVASLPDVTTTLTEGAKSVRIVLKTTNPAEVKDLRRLAREQVQSLAKTGHAR